MTHPADNMAVGAGKAYDSEGNIVWPAEAVVKTKVKNVASVTPHDTNDLDNETIGVYVGTAGDLKVNMAGEGEGIIFADLAAGIWHPLCVTRIYDADTTADDILIAW